MNKYKFSAVRFYVTEKCNASCPNCFNAQTRSNSEMDLTKFTQDRSSWLQSVKEQFSEIVNWFPEKKPAFLSIFVCPGNKDGLLQNGIREDMLIREYVIYSL